MTRMISTRISDDEFNKIMKKCGDLGCSTYEYFKALIQTDIMDEKPDKLQTEEFEIPLSEEQVKDVIRQTLKEELKKIH